MDGNHVRLDPGFSCPEPSAGVRLRNQSLKRGLRRFSRSLARAIKGGCHGRLVSRQSAIPFLPNIGQSSECGPERYQIAQASEGFVLPESLRHFHDSADDEVIAAGYPSGAKRSRPGS